MEHGEITLSNDGTPSYRAVFFDLDGTLVPMELEDLLVPYYRIIGERVAAEGADPKRFIAALNDAITAMMRHEPGRTNADAFWERFLQNVERDDIRIGRGWEDFFDDFYANGYPAIGGTVVPNPAASDAVRHLASLGYPLVLATMPLFPRTAVDERLRWADVDPAVFSRVTSFENSTAAKPDLRYYRENLAAAGLRGEDVLMVGNNTVEDYAIAELGADVFLVTDYLLDPTTETASAEEAAGTGSGAEADGAMEAGNAGGFDLSRVKHGSLADFAEWVQTLPPCANPARSMETGVVAHAES